MTTKAQGAQRNTNADGNRVREVDASLSMIRVNAITVAVLPFLAGGMLLPHSLLWGFPSFPESSGLLAVVLAFLIGMILQQFLHKVGWWRWGRIDWDDIEFGVVWRSFAPYASTETEMPASGYRRGVALPLLVLGALPALAGVIMDLPVLTWFALAMLIASGSEMATLWSMRRMDDEQLVRDHPDRTGCIVLVVEEERAPRSGA